MSFFKKDVPDGNGLFIKLKDGESVEGIFRGTPKEFYQIFKDKTEYPDYVPNSSYKFKMPFIVREDGKPVAKIFQQGVKARRRLEYLFDEFGIDAVYKIKRVGSTKDNTEYHIDKKADLTPEQVEQMNKVELPSLESTGKDDKFSSDGPPPPEGSPVFDDEEDLPF